MRKNERIRKIGVISLLMLVMSTSLVYAEKKKGSFSFNFSSYVLGKTEFSLAGKETNCDSTANTYRNGSVHKTKYTYGITLDGNGLFKPNYKGSTHSANGKKYRTSYGIIKKNTYTVNVGSDDDLNMAGVNIKGTGTLYQ